MFRVLAAVVGLATASCSKSEVKSGGNGDPPTPAKPTFTLFALAELRGQIGPCGCTSDPLGDIARTAKLVADARAAGPVLFVDAGSLLYAQNPIPAHLVAQEELKADLLAKIYKDDLQVGALGVGPADLAAGVEHVRLPREAVNVGGVVPVTAPVVTTVGGAKVGVFGVVDAGAIKLATTDPTATGKRAVAELRGKGAEVIVALVQASSRRDATRLVREIGGIDFAVLGLGLEAPEPERVPIEADKTGGAWLVVPGNRGQVVSRVDVTIRPGGGPFVDAVGSAAATAKIAQLDRELAQRDAELARFTADPNADRAFVAQKRDERGKLAAERDQLAAQPLRAPPRGSYFTLAQIRVTKVLACDTRVQDEVTAYFHAAGEANAKAAAGRAVTPPPKGQASYVGTEKCDDCHHDAVEYWKKTVHAQAWKTLVERGQERDLDCIRCHVTGWDQPGGSNLGHVDNLKDVQCETCHGPGSIHVAKNGEEKPSAVVLAPPKELCASQCHTKEHSDTFQYEAYLRDIVGKGHGEKARDKLGDGPTGHSLRGAALDKAGRTLGSGCVR
jgi:hypothetical protein